MKSTSESPQVRLKRKLPAYCRVVFDNPPLNLMGPEFVVQFKKIMTELEADEHVKVVVFESAVEGYFLNHSDFLAKLEDLTNLPQGPTGLEAWPDILVRLTRAPFVSIALIRGRATGNGSEIALACDMSFASRELAVLSQWEVGVGLVAGGGPMARLPRLIGRNRALEVLLSSDDILVAGCRARRLRRRARDAHRLVRQVGDRQYEAPGERGESAARRRDRGRMGCLHDVDHAGSRAATDTGTFGSRLPEAGRRREPIGVLGRTTRSVTAGRSRPRHNVSNHCHIRKESDSWIC